MKKINIILLLTAIYLLTATLQLAAQDAGAILEKMDQALFSPKDKQGKITMILIDKDGKEKVREAFMMQKGADKKLFRYTQPDSQAGIATLSLPDGVMWLYMPAFENPKKISLLAKSQAFTGTDFSYEDMATEPYSDRYTTVLLKTDPDAYQLELTPVSGKSDYAKILITVDKINFYPKVMEYYNKAQEKIKEATYQYEKIGPYWNAKEVVMTHLKKNHQTRILLSDIKFDQGLTDDDFTVEKLKP